jgi:hypothetical protein
VSWLADPPQGSVVTGYCWAIDIADPFDETPRLGPFDVRHWSAWSPTVTHADVSALLPLPPAATRSLYIEARDGAGLRSRVVVVLDFVRRRPTQPLLIVNDTRFTPERTAADGSSLTVGDYPNQAEFDSLLFARGGFPWQGYPAGTMSPPGVFSGYAFDSLGTRAAPSQDPVPPLETLLRYRDVVWIVDPGAGLPTDPGRHALRLASTPGRQNPLAAYVNGGGRLWLVGGGAAMVLCRPFNRTQNDAGVLRFSNLAGELVPGRFMYDLAHWRSELQTWVTTAPNLARATRLRHGPGAAVLGRFPASLTFRSLATDPLPPGRLTRPNSFYLPRPSFTVEYLSEPNAIYEDLFPGRRERLVSTLDSVYTTTGGYPPPGLVGPPPERPVMTVYRGRENGMVVFSGFDLWSWQRPQMSRLAEAVLTGLWGLERQPVPVATPVATGQDPSEETLLRR